MSRRDREPIEFEPVTECGICGRAIEPKPLAGTCGKTCEDIVRDLIEIEHRINRAIRKAGGKTPLDKFVDRLPK